MKRNDQPSLYFSLDALEKKYNLRVILKKSKRARRITLRVCQITGEVRITTPIHLRQASLENFVKKNMEWITIQASRLVAPINIYNGISITLLGKDRKIVMNDPCQTKYLLNSNSLMIPKTDRGFNNQVKNTFIKMAEDYFTENCVKYSEMLKVSFAKISIRDPKSRWGSCSSERRLMFSWRLIMAPLEVSSYVAAHEVAHLILMDHSKDFWTIVRSLMPDYESRRSWLRENGRKLHRLKF